jgi:hypothetical protein
MDGRTVTRLTTGSLALLLTGSIGYGIHLRDAAAQADRHAASWQREAAAWQGITRAVEKHDALVSGRNRVLVRRYNRLVDSTSAREQRLLDAVSQAQQAVSSREAAAAAAAAQQAVSGSSGSSGWSGSSGGGSGGGSSSSSSSSASAAPAVQPAPAQAPASGAS